MATPRDENRIPSLLAVSATDGTTPVSVYVNATTHRLYVDVSLSDITALTGVIDGEVVEAADKGILILGTDGSNYQVLSTDSSGNLQVDIVSSATIAVTNAGTFATQATLQTGSAAIGKLAANTGVDIGDVDVTSISGGIAHDAADSGTPVKIGGRADTTSQAVVADGDRVDALFDVYGQLRTRVDHANPWSMHSDGSSALTDTSVQGAPGAGLSVYITDIVFSTGAATACNIFFEEGATKILGPYYLEAIAGRGLALHFTTPKKCTANTAVTVTTSAAIAQGLDVLGFISP